MTNTKVVVSEAKSSIGMAITVSISQTSLFSTVVSTPPPPVNEQPPQGGAYISISRLNAWVDSMRASSPTRLSSTSSLSEKDDHISWMIRHPSALTVFEDITHVSKGKKIVMFLDYDGTLAPIVEDPERAFMSREMRMAVRDAARYFPTSIVTGRCIDTVYKFVKLEQLYYAGSHGMDIKGPVKGAHYKKGDQPVIFQPANEFLSMIDEVYKVLVEITKSTQGAKVENNKFCVSVHFRRVDENKWMALADKVKMVLNGYPELKLTQGRKVLEIRPTIKWDKGKALEYLLESLGYANSNDVLPIYIGDDRTDEDAFKVLNKRGQGFGILVSKYPKETSASYSLQDPSEVKDFLARLVEWKRAAIKGHRRSD